MVYTQPLCAKWGSEHTRCTGSSQGANYQGKACGYQARFTPAAKAAQYAQVEKLLVERSPQRRIERATGVARMTVAKLLKKSARNRSPTGPRLRRRKARKRRWEVLELDERWTFVGSKAHKIWRWLGVERANRRIVAWVLGERRAQNAQRLWHALPRRYRRHCW